MNECFPNEWKKANIMQVHKNSDKQSKITDLFHSSVLVAKSLKKSYLILFLNVKRIINFLLLISHASSPLIYVWIRSSH